MLISSEKLHLESVALTEYGDNIDVLKNDSDIIIHLLDNCEISIYDANRFFVRVNCERAKYGISPIRSAHLDPILEREGIRDGEECAAYYGYYDFGHTCTEWNSVISLGIYGLRERVREYAESRANESSRSFYSNVLRVYDASIRFMRRCAECAIAEGRREMGESLLRLTERRPETLYEAMQTSLVYYALQQFFDATPLRTLGRLDGLLYPYYVKEEKSAARALIADYIREIDSLGVTANIPFAICGTDIHGRDLTNELSYELLYAYRDSSQSDTKLHILCSESTPKEIIRDAFSAIRDGKNSIVFLSDKRVIESLVNQGADRRDAVKYHVVGCYECGADGEITCSCNAKVNIPKAIELTLNRGRDMLTDKEIGLPTDSRFESYSDILSEFKRQLAYLCSRAMRATDIYESHSSVIHSSPILSGAYTSALERGGDVYVGATARYNNSSLNAIGLATAADSLYAIRRAVFEDKILTLEELTDTLRENWKDREYLRLLIKNKYPKYGQGNTEVDSIARGIVDTLADSVSGKPNTKGGTYRLGLFSIDWRWEMGERSAASADGRLASEPLSQNTGASFGADKLGATAHLLSASSLDTSRTPNGAIVDIDLHHSAVVGENGLSAMVNTLMTYFSLGGFGVHYNVLNTDVLTDAMEHPEKYPTLQVRLCGWNVLFSTLSDKEKAEFIARSIQCAR